MERKEMSRCCLFSRWHWWWWCCNSDTTRDWLILSYSNPSLSAILFVMPRVWECFHVNVWWISWLAYCSANLKHSDNWLLVKLGDVANTAWFSSCIKKKAPVGNSHLIITIRSFPWNWIRALQSVHLITMMIFFPVNYGTGAQEPELTSRKIISTRCWESLEIQTNTNANILWL